MVSTALRAVSLHRQFHKGAADRYRDALEKERAQWDAERTQMLADAQVCARTCMRRSQCVLAIGCHRTPVVVTVLVSEPGSRLMS